MKLKKLALVAALAFGAMSAQAAGTASANLSIIGSSVGTCTPQAVQVDTGPINFNGATVVKDISLAMDCTDAGVAWSLSTDVEDVDYRVNSVPSGKVTLLTTGLSTAFTVPITGNGSSAAIGAKLSFTPPTAGPHLGDIGANITMVVSY